MNRAERRPARVRPIFTGARRRTTGYGFRLKMMLLLLAPLFHFTVFRLVISAESERIPRVAYRRTGAATLVMWFGVAWSGRAIAFF